MDPLTLARVAAALAGATTLFVLDRTLMRPVAVQSARAAARMPRSRR